MPLLNLEDFCRASDFEPDLEGGLWTVAERRTCAEARKGELMGILGEWHELVPCPILLSHILISVPSC